MLRLLVGAVVGCQLQELKHIGRVNILAQLLYEALLGFVQLKIKKYDYDESK